MTRPRAVARVPQPHSKAVVEHLYEIAYVNVRDFESNEWPVGARSQGGAEPVVGDALRITFPPSLDHPSVGSTSVHPQLIAEQLEQVLIIGCEVVT